MIRFNPLIFIALFMSNFSCQESQVKNPNSEGTKVQETKVEPQTPIINKSGNTVDSRFNCPEGFTRVVNNENSWGLFLQKLPVKSDGSPVLLFDGHLKENQGAHLAVVNLSIGRKDLHQCADAVMRLRADYLFSQKRFNEITFRQASGRNLSYTSWLAGKSPSLNNHWSYLEDVFNTANTGSLDRQLIKKSIKELEIGDVFITGPPPGQDYGHAVIVVDKCQDPNGKVMFMLAQSYMPAQEIQVLNNPSNPGSPWHDLDFGSTLETAEYPFTNNQLKSFE